MSSKLIDPLEKGTMTFDWGVLKPLVERDDTAGHTLSVLQAVLLPGSGHERHNHPEADELLYFISGQGMQMVDDGEEFPVRAGDAVLIDEGVWHSTINTGWEPLVVLAVYTPAGPEEILPTLPGFRSLPAGEMPVLRRD